MPPSLPAVRHEVTVTITPQSETSLSPIYRRARALATADEARPDEALAFADACAAVFGAGGEEQDQPPATQGASAQGRLQERVRRAAIVALRRQALLARRAWVEEGGQGLLRQATLLVDGAVRLHHVGDPGRDETEYLSRYLRATEAVAAMPVRRAAPQVPEPAAAGASPPAPPEREPTPAPDAPVSAPALEAIVVGLPPEAGAEPEGARARPTRIISVEETDSSRPRRPVLVSILAAIAVAAFVAGAFTAPRLIGRRRAEPGRPVALTSPATRPSVAPKQVRPPVASPVEKVSPPLAVVAPDPVRTPTPAAATPAASPPPAASPKPATVGLLVRSDPSGASVFIDGVPRGTTPLQLEAKPGSVLRVTVRRGTRTWRGTIRVGRESAQTTTIRLPVPVVVAQATATPAPTPTLVPTTAPTPSPAPDPKVHFAGLMRQGVELYQGGWYGPAMARFRRATAVMPGSSSAHLWLGRAAIKAGRYAEARRALEQVIALAPGSPAAREAQALLVRFRLIDRGA